MNKIEQLLSEIDLAREQYLLLIVNLGEEDAAIKPSQSEWSVVDNTEHLFWAEQGALYGMYKILYAIRSGGAERTLQSPHKDWPIKKLIEHTWKEKEQVPLMAAPRLGGTVVFWRHSLASLQPVLAAFAKDLQEDELRLLAHPHPISGAMDFQQRLEFLRFHIQRHHVQVQSIILNLAQNA